MKLTIAEAWPLIKEGTNIRTNAQNSYLGAIFSGEIVAIDEGIFLAENGRGSRHVYLNNGENDAYIEIINERNKGV